MRHASAIAWVAENQRRTIECNSKLGAPQVEAGRQNFPNLLTHLDPGHEVNGIGVARLDLPDHLPREADADSPDAKV